MEVLTLQQAGFLAWSKSKKNKCLFATASIYDSFSQSDAPTDPTLQIYSLDIVNRTSSSQKLGLATFQEGNFTSIDWENFGENDSFPYGVIATGFDNGVVGLWDPNAIINGESSGDSAQRGLISLQEVHEAPVNTIAFNPFRQHLIASGGVEVAIHNLEKNVAEPDVFSPGSDVHQGSAITSVSWNRKVPHILGSASQNGVSVVWDLKLNQSIFNFSDPSRVANNRNVCLSWNPEIPTQIAVVYDDAKVPELQIWDLRNPKGPIFCTEKGHTKGIHYLDWSVSDPSLIITVGRDNKTCIWNYKLSSDNLVSEFNSDEPISQVKWSPRQPEIYSVSNNSGTSTIYSLNNQIDHIPAWIRPPVGARFSFDGRLATFSEQGGFSVQEFKVSTKNEGLEPYLQEFEQAFSTSRIDLQKLAQSRTNSALLNDQERQQWAFIGGAAKNDVDDLIEALGFDKNTIIKKAENYTGKYYVTRATTTTNHKVESDFKLMTAEEAEDFFGNLGKKEPKEGSGKKNASMAEIDDEYTTHENVTKNTNWNAGTEKIIKTNILIGNIEGAVDSALKCGRVAEALLLAYAKGGEFFKSTIKSYVTSCNDPFVKNVIRYLVEDQIDELVQNYSLDDWKECVALCISLSQKHNSNSFKLHMEQLATRFIQERNDYDTALLCHIISKNFVKILETFALASEQYQKGTQEHTIFLINTVEKIIALKMLVGYFEPNSLVDRFLFELSKVLQVHGRELLILNLLTINDSFGFECLVIRDRLLNSSLEFQQLFTAKRSPFRQEVVNIRTKKAKVEPHRKGSEPVDGMGGPKPIRGGGPITRPPISFPTAEPEKKTGFESHPPTIKKFEPVQGCGGVPKPGPIGFGAKRETSPFPTPSFEKSEPISHPPIGGGPVGFGKPSTPFSNPNPHTNPDLQKSTQDLSGNIGGAGTKVMPPVMKGGPPSFKGGNMPKPNIPKPLGGPSGLGGPIQHYPTPGTHQVENTFPPTSGQVESHIGGPTGGMGGGQMSGSMSGPIGGVKGFAPPNVGAGGFGVKPVQEVNPGFGKTGVPPPKIGGGVPSFGGKVGQVNPPIAGGPGKFIPTGQTMGMGMGMGVSQPKVTEPAKPTVDVQPIYDTIGRGLQLLEQIDQGNPKKKAEMDQKIQQLYNILGAGTMKPVTVNDLTRLCKAIDAEDYNTATTLQQKIDREDYVSNRDWLYVTRRIVARK